MIEPYEPEKHYEVLKAWITKRGKCPMPPRDFFPPTGFIAPGLAACFVYLTNSAVAFIENVISNPDADPKEREKALNEVGNAVVEQAKSHGAKMLIGFTKLETIKKHASLLGMRSIENYALLVREI